ncbi:MAG: alanine racemase [Alphaproteobacteria bacterium]
MSIFTRPILEINLNKLLENYTFLKNKAFGAIPAAVLKDDAYGLGTAEVAKILYEKANCKAFFVAHAVEAEKIRPYVENSVICVLQGMGEDNIELFKRLNLIPVISSWEQFEFWKQNKIENINPVLHVETGLNRLGFRISDLEKLTTKDIAEFSCVMSHLACADSKEHFMNEKQLQNFKEIKNKFFPNTLASLSASDGVFLGQDYTFDMVRLGAAMYGINTTPYHESQMENVVKIKAPVLEICDLKEGEYVGYGATYKALSNRKIAIMSIGYGDGLPRILSNVGKVFFEKQQANMIGRISMDNLICDVTDITNLKVGDFVSVIDDFYTVDDMGYDAGTIGYEILSRFGKNPRFIRKYIK